MTPRGPRCVSQLRHTDMFPSTIDTQNFSERRGAGSSLKAGPLQDHLHQRVCLGGVDMPCNKQEECCNFVLCCSPSKRTPKPKNTKKKNLKLRGYNSSSIVLTCTDATRGNRNMRKPRIWILGSSNLWWPLVTSQPWSGPRALSSPELHPEGQG